LPEGLRENHREQRAQEQRQEYRLNNQLTVIIELDSPADSEPTLVVSTSIDISANGLRAISPQAVPTDNILRCCIRDAASDQQFLVVTEVKWCRAHGEHGDFLIGLSLFDSTGTDIVEWKEFIAQRYAE
jgi:hypothetical protein